MTSNITPNSTDNIISELFKYINSIRQSNNLNLFSHDYLSEYILSNLFRLKKGPPSNNEIDAKFVSQGCVYLDKLIYPISTQINNEPSYQLYSSIIQQELSNNKNNPILSNGIYSHLGIYVKNIDINFYIFLIFSSKIASYDEVIGCNDGNILIGTILKPDHYIEGAFVKDITGIKGCPFGPKNIRYNNDTKKFYLCLLNSISSSINNNKKLVKTVYQTNLNNIPYGAANALGRNVDFRGGNIAENQIVSFINEDKSQIFNGNVMDYITKLGFANSNSVGSATKNKLDIKSKILAYNQNKNNENNNNNSNKFSCVILTPKKKNSTGLSTIIEDNNDLNKSFIRNSMPKFEGISPIATKTLSPGNYNNKRTTSDLITTINGVNISPIKKSDFNNNQNPFETKSKLLNDNQLSNNNQSKNSFNNSNINNFSFFNSNNNNNNIPNSNNNINNQINNNNGFFPRNNNLFNSINQTQTSNNVISNNQNNNIINSMSKTLGNPFNNSNQINNNMNNNQFNSNSNLFNKYNNNNYIQNNIYSSQQFQNNQNNNINNYNNRPAQNQLIKIEQNVIGYQIISTNIKYKSLLDIQNIGNQNLNISPKLNLSTNQEFCINLYNINSSGIQACQTTSRPKSDLMNYISLIKKKYPISKMDQIKFVQNNLQTIIEDFYGKKTVLTYEKLLEIQKNRDNSDTYDDYIINEKDGKDNINNLINKGEYLNIIFPNFDYKKDSETKEKNSQSQDVTNSLNNSEIENKSMYEKIYVKMANEYLNSEERNERYKYNPSFEHLYYSHDFSDVILKLNNNIIQAHKVVLASSSKVFMELIKSAEEEFKYNRNQQFFNMNNNGTNIIEVLLPENFDFKIFNEIIKWIYCGKINENLSIETLRIMLIMSEKLKINTLVKILIIKYIIPQISKDNAISLCIDAYSRGNSNHETSSCWDLLLNYSLNYIGKNSISLIKTNPEKLLIMDIGLLIKCVKICMDSILDIEQLSNLLQILIQKGIAHDIFDLLNKEVEKIKMCRCYDSQNINIDLLLNYFEIKNNPFSLPLINEETVVNNVIMINNNDISFNSNNNRNSVSPFILYDNDRNSIYEKNITINNPSKDQSFLSTSMNSKKNNILNNTNSNFTFARNEDSIFNINNQNSSNFTNENNSSFNLYESNLEEEKNYNDIYNYLSPNTNTNYQENIRNEKYFVFDFVFKFPNESKYSDINMSNGLSVFSEKFEYRGHLWTIKIDINNNGDFSFFLIERGDSMNFDKNNSLIKFNSILFEFVIRDTNFEKSNQIFFSFVKNQHQIIGHKNFININQLTNKNKFHFILYIKRFPLHSGIMHYLSENFNYIFLNKKNDIDRSVNLYLLSKENYLQYKNLKKAKKNYNNNLFDLINSNNNNDQRKNQNLLNLKFEYLNVNQFDLISILYSDYLPVESENTIIGVIYFYCMKKDPKYIDNVMKGIRYEFVNFRILCSLARDHDAIKNCPSFRKEFKLELKKRIKKMNDNNNTMNNNRLYLRKNIRRNNYNLSNNEDGLNGMNISDEIITFFLEKRNHEEYKDKLISLKNELKEEKRMTEERIKNLEQENVQLNLEKNRLINENKRMKNKIINKGMMEQINLYNENNNNTNAFSQADEIIKQNTDFNSCNIF
mgnify:FL=1